MASSNGSDCAFAEELYDIIPLQVVQWMYIFTSILSITLVFYTARNYLHRTIFENVTKELIVALYVYITIFSICLIFAQGSQLAYRYLATQKCDAQVPKVWCIFRYILTVLTSTFIFIHTGITLQFLFASFHFRSRAEKIAARLSIVISLVYALLFAVVAYYKESVEGRTPYCSGWTANSEGILMFNLYFSLVPDILNTLVSLFLWKYNEGKMIEDRNSFDLSLSFHRRQILYAMEQFLPVTALHALFYLVFFREKKTFHSEPNKPVSVTNIFSQSIKSSMSSGWYLTTSVIANITPHYCFLCPLIFLILIRRGHFKRVSHVRNMINQERNPNELYFSALKGQWH
ncbi:hypothetical protein PMAYCL1PPCAC_08201 [Pristionchus mayeri]|uniref:G protein-coupled receptor n=1 Tax=Pristionchus mayeri TaxID=1317129 RepID=A0AAN4ZF69_9BILA|nr:hypothetical protein PMAYCL1PPCAC_08201 [Pristionchus mayeri]